MANPSTYNTLDRQATWPCIVCRSRIGVEHRGHDSQGRAVFAPASRYWHDDGVLCGPEHSYAYHQPRNYP
jgi:hypothetical protein